MATAPVLTSDAVEPANIPMSLEEYLRSDFSPDRDYVNGFAEERCVGEFDHGRIQGMLIRIFGNHETDWKIQVIPELRIQVAPKRFRVADVTVLPAAMKVHRFPTTPPLICIEVISPDQTWKKIRDVLSDYADMGVPNIWVIDPEERTAFRYISGSFLPIAELSVEGTEIRISLEEVFAALNYND